MGAVKRNVASGGFQAIFICIVNEAVRVMQNVLRFSFGLLTEGRVNRIKSNSWGIPTCFPNISPFTKKNYMPSISISLILEKC